MGHSSGDGGVSHSLFGSLTLLAATREVPTTLPSSSSTSTPSTSSCQRIRRTCVSEWRGCMCVWVGGVCVCVGGWVWALYIKTGTLLVFPNAKFEQLKLHNTDTARM